MAEDDPNLGQLLREFLDSKGFETVLVTNGDDALAEIKSETFDLCLLDVMMPAKDGFSVARELRRQGNNIPVIFLTARSMNEDTLEGFRSGADDYISKPFSMEELIARINAVLRRTRPVEVNNVYRIGSFEFDTLKEVLKLGEDERKLTTREAALLKMLCKKKNDVLNRTDALKEIWGDDSYFNSRSMDVYVTRLRKYLKADPSIEIANVHGKGFKMIAN